MPRSLPRSLLIANRGEIACRIMRTAHRMGIRTIAVYSEADAQALHVRSADEAWCIGPASARESYLESGRIIAAARAAGAEAIHPGYGFLSESAPFAQACADAGICFVGPPPAAIRAMGSKSAAKALLQQASVPLTPGYHGQDQSADHLAEQAGRIGYPVLIKASNGGGGKGMRRVDHAGDFAAALDSCRRESLAAFGSDDVLIEKYILQPRHIEVQVFADTHGNVVHLFERDCSVQRRHQKVLEEAPAPGLTEALRASLGAAAVQVARAVGYVGAGTVEFIAPRAALEPTGTSAHAAPRAVAHASAEASGATSPEADDSPFYFMEMNTRLQVEHPVTEMITGLDLVEWQLRVAAGEALPCRQQDLQMRGHAIEVRLYAEDADHGFTPATGTLVHFETPGQTADLRLDTGVAAGDTIAPHYDPMIAKLIVHGPDRASARARLRAALAQTRIVGVANNVAFLARLVDAPSFAAALLDTDLIERDAAALAAPTAPPPRDIWLIAVLAMVAAEAHAVPAGSAASAWGRRDGWRVNGVGRRAVPLAWQGQGAYAPVAAGGAMTEVGVTVVGEQFRLALAGADSDCRVRWDATPSAGAGGHDTSGRVWVNIDARFYEGRVVAHAGRWHVFCGARHDVFVAGGEHHAGAVEGEDTADTGVLAPMPGRVIALLVDRGSAVERDAPLLIIEAMKMEHTLRAPRAGIVAAFRVAMGDQVAMGEQLLDFAAAAPSTSASA